MESISITEARRRLLELPEELNGTGQVAVTRRGKPVLALLPWELYEAIAETLEILQDEEAMAAFRKGLAEARAGKSVSWDEAKERLGL